MFAISPSLQSPLPARTSSKSPFSHTRPLQAPVRVIREPSRPEYARDDDVSSPSTSKDADYHGSEAHISPSSSNPSGSSSSTPTASPQPIFHRDSRQLPTTRALSPSTSSKGYSPSGASTGYSPDHNTAHWTHDLGSIPPPWEGPIGEGSSREEGRVKKGKHKLVKDVGGSGTAASVEGDIKGQGGSGSRVVPLSSMTDHRVESRQPVVRRKRGTSVWVTSRQLKAVQDGPPDAQTYSQGETGTFASRLHSQPSTALTNTDRPRRKATMKAKYSYLSPSPDASPPRSEKKRRHRVRSAKGTYKSASSSRDGE